MEEYYQIKNSKYQINKLGQVRRIFKNGTVSYLQTSTGKNGYLKVRIDNNKDKNVHRLLGLTFLENPDNKPCVDHIDRNRINNDLNNLRWVTYKENSNNREPSKGGVYKTKDKVGGKIYEGWRAYYIINDKKKTKRFKKKEDAEKWLQENNII
jgi:hypothetical protein